MHVLISSLFLHKLCSVATLEHSELFLLKNHVLVVALTPNLRRASFYSVPDFLRHSSTIELLLSLIHKKVSYLSSYALQTMQEIVISLVAAVACKFMHGGHVDRDLESRQVTISG